METYRIWLYGYSVTLLLMLIGFVFCLQTVVTPVWISLFPFSMTDTIWFFLYTNLALQGVDIALCLYGVACNKPIVLQVFWVMGLVLLFADVLYFGLSVPYWQRIINSTDLHLYETLMLQYSRPSFCVLMNGAQKQFGCCGARSYTDFSSLPNLCDEIIGENASSLPLSCCTLQTNFCQASSANLSLTGCSVPLLRWLNGRKDMLTLYGFCLVVLVKISGLVILKSEIRKLLVDVTARKSVDTSLILHMVSVDSSAVSNVAEQNQGDVVRSIMTYGRKSSRLERMFPFRQMYVEPSRRNSKTSFVQ